MKKFHCCVSIFLFCIWGYVLVHAHQAQLNLQTPVSFPPPSQPQPPLASVPPPSQPPPLQRQPRPQPRPQPQPQPRPRPQPEPNHESFAPMELNLTNFGFLSLLPGTWTGYGFNIIALPNFDSRAPSTGPSNFRVLLSQTTEILSFTPIGGGIPNRGSMLNLENGTSSSAGFFNESGQADIEMFGLQYRQDVNQTNTRSGTPEGIHTEVGTWLNVPGSDYPPQGPTLVRMATIPHGNAFTAQSTFATKMFGGPIIDDGEDSFPFVVTDGGLQETLITDLNYLEPYLTTENLPDGITPEIVRYPNLLLKKAIVNQNITETIVFILTTDPERGGAGGVVNIPFVQRNADVKVVEATFWIETVEELDGTTFLQLQYSQTTYLDFLGIRWPHISIATLVKANAPFQKSPSTYGHY